jgi:hypothetical protein
LDAGGVPDGFDIIYYDMISELSLASKQLLRAEEAAADAIHQRGIRLEHEIYCVNEISLINPEI